MNTALPVTRSCTYFSFGTLSAWAWNLGSLFFRLIDIWYPDPVFTPPAYMGRNIGISGDMAVLVVSFPIYLVTMRIILRDLARQPEKLDSGVCKWLTYLALLISASVLIGDLTTTVDYLLRGEITVRFTCKVINGVRDRGRHFSLLSSAARKAGGAIANRDRIFAALASVAVLTGLALGFRELGPPRQQRAENADVIRSRDLTSLLREIDSFHRLNQHLPATLEELKKTRPGVRVNDPETHAPYTYSVLDDKQYQLCATFATEQSRHDAGSVRYRSSCRNILHFTCCEPLILRLENECAVL